MNILNYQHFYLVGIKGVALTALAQCLVDAGKNVQGSDVAEDFVTQRILETLDVKIDVGFEAKIPENTDCVVYTAAHQAQQNPQVVDAVQKNIPTISHAEALGSLFNQKKGIAVCGVGGKSTTSAMIVWILEKTSRKPSFAVGVGNIPGLNRTGRWQTESEYFVAEADEYVTDPSAPSRGEEITPRFSFMNPFLTVCTNLKYDHPDVYKDLAHTEHVFRKFFDQIQEGGILIANDNDKYIIEKEVFAGSNLNRVISFFGEEAGSEIQLLKFEAQEGETTSEFEFQQKKYVLKLKIPGKYNVMNALAAIRACAALSVTIEDCIMALGNFSSTMRRSEFIGEKNGVKYYDDYAHHPDEVGSVISAYHEWFPNRRLVVGFQSHTFSRTKKLFADFVTAFEHANEVVMIDIFPSAREKFDPTVTSDALCQAVYEKFKIPAQNVHTIEGLAKYCREKLHSGDIFLTVGAGDIYKVHELLK